VSTAAQPSGGDELLADLVFEGGGVKGIGLAGAYRELSDRGYQPQCVAGTSAGAITAALVAVGYTGPELEDVVLRQMHFPDFEDHTLLDHLGAPGEIAQFFKSRGMHSGDFFLKWMGEQLAAKGITKFGQLRNPASSNASRAYRLQLIASDLTARSMLVLPRDADQLGIDPDELEIAQAVRMSMSIPVFFQPVTVHNERTGQNHVIVDGGLLSNYPIWLFDCPTDAPPQFPTFGMLLVAPGQQAPLLPAPPPGEQAPDMGSDVEFLKAIGETMMEAHDRFYVEQANYARTIPIPTLGVKTTQFDIAPAQSQALFDSGKAAAQQFLNSWDFDAYKRKFRTGQVPSRRETALGSGSDPSDTPSRLPSAR
jgi:NTE family protein